MLYYYEMKMKCSLSNAYTRQAVTSGVRNGTGFMPTQFYLPPIYTFIHEMSHPAFTS